ncbi:MAG: hypothetical protein IPH08_00445 [Rhodocyclaceae bacterium]|nr:hypothetical protein [Rhodocyclaceae bacterium]
MELRDVLDVDAPPKTVQDTVVGKRLEKGYLLGARCLSIGEHLELSGAVYIFPYWTTQALLADLRNVPALTPDLAPIIRRHWLAQFVATDEFEDD